MRFGREGSIPLRFQGGVAAPLIKRSPSSAAQTGWLVNSKKIRCGTRARITITHFARSLLKISAVADAWPQVIACFNKYLKTRGETNAQHFHGSDAAAVSASCYRRHGGWSQNSLQRL